MEEYKMMKLHKCKFCSKSFPCGRSLGGHMRSHMINSCELEDERLSKGKFSASFDQIGYGLRENPKKTSRFADPKVQTLLHGKLCKICHKEFQSWKALIEHMRCHSKEQEQEQEEDDGEEEEEEEEEEESWISRSSSESDDQNHRKIKYSISMAPANRTSTVVASSSVRFTPSTDTTSPCSVSEQEEVAMCLMMLSRDASHWGGFNNCPNSSRNQRIRFEPNDSSIESAELRRSIMGRDRTNPNKSYSNDDFSKLGQKWRDFKEYRCGTCNKSFHSYQALGGHRASHKKIRGCSASKPEFKHSSFFDDEASDRLVKSRKIEDRNSKKGHQCPICFRVFLSGQALGGHKRSHFIGGARNYRTETPESSDLLDLNLPAAAEDAVDGEDSDDHNMRQWWVGSCSRRSESLVGVISD